MNVAKIADSILNKKAVTSFKTKITSISNVNVKNIESWSKVDKTKSVAFDAADLMIEWDVDFEMREWGVKSAIIVIRNIYGTLTVTYEDIEESYEFNADKENFTMQSNMKFSGDVLRPSEIEIDFSIKKAFVE